MQATVSGLLTAAQRAGSVHPDVTAADLLALVRGVAVTAGSPEQQARLLDLVRQAVDARPHD